MLLIHPRFANRTPQIFYTYILILLVVHPHFAVRTSCFCCIYTLPYQMKFSCHKKQMHFEKFSNFGIFEKFHFHFSTFTSWSSNLFQQLTFFFFDELIAFFNTYAGSQGYAVVKQRTKKNPKINEMMKVYFRDFLPRTWNWWLIKLKFYWWIKKKIMLWNSMLLKCECFLIFKFFISWINFQVFFTCLTTDS